jgi:hypothetical protein
MTEAQIQDAIRLELGNVEKYPDVVLWRNNVGVLMDKDGRHVRFGVGGPGGADLMGVFSRRDGIGVFIAAEIKTATGKQSEEQIRFQKLVTQKGGACVVLRSVDDAKQWIEQLRSMSARKSA